MGIGGLRLSHPDPPLPPTTCAKGGKRQQAWGGGCFGWRPFQSCRALGILPPSPEPPFGGTGGWGGPQDVAPHLSPTNLTAHASTRSQTSKNVKHVDARGGGRGEMLIGALG